MVLALASKVQALALWCLEANVYGLGLGTYGLGVGLKGPDLGLESCTDNLFSHHSQTQSQTTAAKVKYV